MAEHNDNTAKGTVTLQVPIPRQRMRDILTTAYESGISYWACDGDFDYVAAVRDENGYVMEIAFRRAAGATIPVFVPSIRGRTSAVVTDTDLAIAFGRALAIGDDGEPVYVDAAGAAIAELTGKYDAASADVLVQFALFGDVIYG